MRNVRKTTLARSCWSSPSGHSEVTSVLKQWPATCCQHFESAQRKSTVLNSSGVRRSSQSLFLDGLEAAIHCMTFCCDRPQWIMQRKAHSLLAVFIQDCVSTGKSGKVRSKTSGLFYTQWASSHSLGRRKENPFPGTIGHESPTWDREVFSGIFVCRCPKVPQSFWRAVVTDVLPPLDWLHCWFPENFPSP